MRIAVVFFGAKQRENIRSISQGLVKGIETQGCQVDLIDGSRDVNTKLTIYNYIAVGTESVNLFGGKISKKIAEYLAGSGIVTGKKSFAFVTSSGFRSQKTLSALMKAMEHEGMFLKNSTVLSSQDEAFEIGKSLHISK